MPSTGASNAAELERSSVTRSASPEAMRSMMGTPFSVPDPAPLNRRMLNSGLSSVRPRPGKLGAVRKATRTTFGADEDRRHRRTTGEDYYDAEKEHENHQFLELLSFA